MFGGFFRVRRFLHLQNWLPRYNLNIVESGVKHHIFNPILLPTIEAYAITNSLFTVDILYRPAMNQSDKEHIKTSMYIIN